MPARPLPPVSTPLNVPPVGPIGTTLRTVTGMVVWPSSDETTTDWSVSPLAVGVVRLRVAEAVCPGRTVKNDGVIDPAGAYCQVWASH